MEAYSEFANVYDIFMEDTPYEQWFEFIKSQVSSHNGSLETVCELGCGTGQMTTLFAKEGSKVIGIDYSPEMLMVAQDHAYEEELEILYLMQDMSEFEIGEEVDLIYSACDSINYLLEEEMVLSTFKGVYNSLQPNGLFIFDLNTIYKYQEVLGNHIFADQLEHAAYIWENYYDEDEQINEYEVSFFIEDETGKYDRTVENHYQKGYSKACITRLLEEAGLTLLKVYDNYTFSPAHEQTERMTFVVQKK